jgi:putative transposase
MPRRPREGAGGLVYHVLNRAVRADTIFSTNADYQAFEDVLREAHAIHPLPILDYCVMPSHWHLLLWPQEDEDLSEFMHWLTLTHTQRYHAFHGSIGMGPLYQGRFRSFPVQDDEHFLTVARYVERNPVRAGLVPLAQDWPWGSLWCRLRGDAEGRAILSDWPCPHPPDWIEWVNRPLTGQELEAVRLSVTKGRPFGQSAWQSHIAERLGIESTFHRRGRPGKGVGDLFPREKRP